MGEAKTSGVGEINLTYQVPFYNNCDARGPARSVSGSNFSQARYMSLNTSRLTSAGFQTFYRTVGVTWRPPHSLVRMVLGETAWVLTIPLAKGAGPLSLGFIIILVQADQARRLEETISKGVSVAIL